MKIFNDSSALVKRYIEEPDSDRITELIAEADEIAVSIVCLPEVLSECNRLLRQKKINREQYGWIKNEFLIDIKEFTIIDLTNEVIIRSIQCLEHGVLRSLDALHLSSAVEYHCDLFGSSDRRQNDSAASMGLIPEMV